MRRLAIIFAAAGLAVGVAACGEPADYGGYPTAEDACAAVQGSVAQGPYREDDGREAACDVDGPTGAPIQVESGFYSDDSEATDAINTWTVEVEEADDVAGGLDIEGYDD